MNPRNLIPMIVTACSVAVAGIAAAQPTQRAADQAQIRQQSLDRVYGSQLMSDQERDEFRSRMRELNTSQERDQFRKEHQTQMQERAKERGVTIPAETPTNARGAGPRDGSGAGKGNMHGSGGGGGKGR